MVHIEGLGTPVGRPHQVPFSRVLIGGVPTDTCGRQQLLDRIDSGIRLHRASAGHAKVIVDINCHGLSLARTDSAYRAALEAADIVHADGQPIVLASRLTKHPIPNRSATTDLIHDVSKVSVVKGYGIYLLGSRQEVAENAVRHLRELHPGVRIVGFRNGYFSEEDEPEICRQINESGADVVFVGLGKPKEQAFAIRNRARIRAACLITSGGCFDFLGGGRRRAPKLLQQLSLEWLYRLWQEPRRLFWRYFKTNIHALWLIATATGGTVESGVKRQEGL